MDITAVVKVYNECQFISCCVQSLKDSVDRIVILDGAYELYYRQYKKFNPNAKPWSTDGTLEIVRAMKDLPTTKILRCTKPWVNQTVKLTAMLDEVEDNGWFIIIDADEMILGDLSTAFTELERSGCIVGRIPMVTLGADADRLHYFWHPRLFRKQKGFHYTGTHWQLRDFAGRIVENSYPVWWTQHCVIAHLKLLKAKKRMEPHLRYMRQLRDRGWLEPERTELSHQLKK